MMCFHRKDGPLSCRTITIGAVETAAVGISGAAAVVTGIEVVVLPSAIGIGFGKGAAVGVSVTVLDD